MYATFLVIFLVSFGVHSSHCLHLFNAHKGIVYFFWQDFFALIHKAAYRVDTPNASRQKVLDVGWSAVSHHLFAFLCISQLIMWKHVYQATTIITMYLSATWKYDLSTFSPSLHPPAILSCHIITAYHTTVSKCSK